MSRSTDKIIAGLCAAGDHSPDEDAICMGCGVDVIEDLRSQLVELRVALGKGWTLGQYEWAQAHPDDSV